ncbi:hypothetical protein [Rhizobium sp. SL86]|uniref:hypothetical protein n=1 Tax=Rhizobium sp. SL86 TaxID=2995148 RepID=UPI00227472AB|nr:hypothetical protein [Rhizobium sp. SL86]MCY1669385.1 hypothetical protein [Rhizobium sp. SL86]
MNISFMRPLARADGGKKTTLPMLGQEIGGPADAYLRLEQKRAALTRILLWVSIIIPTSIGFLYYTFFSAPRYVSEARFIVRSVSAPKITGLDVLFRTIGIAKTADDAYIIQKYLVSRDALDALQNESVDVRGIYTRPEADFMSAYPYFWRSENRESLYDYFTDRVSVTEDAAKGIVQLRVTAFRPQDAHQIAETLLRIAENMVNRINERAQEDTIETARAEVARAEANVVEAQSALTDYRNRQLIVDPSKSAATLLETIGKLTAEKASAMAQVKQLEVTAPRNPSLQSLNAKISALGERIKDQQGQLAGGDSALASKLEQYEQFVLKRELADKVLTSSLQSFDDALKEARRQHIYVEQVVRPHLPDYPTEPHRFKSVITILVLGITIFSIGWVLMVGAGEHLH